MRFISGVRHNLNLTADGGFDRITSLPADYGAYERHWIDDLARTEPSRLGTTHHRDTAAGAGSAERRRGLCARRPDFDPDDWVRVLPLAGLVGQIRRRPLASGSGASKLGGIQRLIVAAGLFTTLGLPVYLLFLMITAANVIGPVVGVVHSRGFCSRGQSPLSASAQS